MSAIHRYEGRTAALGVTIPVHNEAALLADALTSLETALRQVNGHTVDLAVTIVLDACSDASASIVSHWQQRTLETRHFSVIAAECDFLNVGMARAYGCSLLLNAFSYVDTRRLWLATTDADSRVPYDWIAVQASRHDAGVDLWAGRVKVDEWSSHSRETAYRWQREYDVEQNPIHGANLGFNAAQYLAVGGFPLMQTGEDRGLVRALIENGARVDFDTSTRVVTSARRLARAPGGFASALQRVEVQSGLTPQLRIA